MGISGNNTGWGWEKQMEKLRKQVEEREAKEEEERQREAAAMKKVKKDYIVTYPVHYGSQGMYYQSARVPAAEWPAFQAAHARCEIVRVQIAYKGHGKETG